MSLNVKVEIWQSGQMVQEYILYRILYYLRMDEFDLEGFDATWDAAQFSNAEETEAKQSGYESDDESIPQCDGPADTRTGNKKCCTSSKHQKFAAN